MNKEKKKNISNTDPLEEQAFATHFGQLKENLIACFKCEYQKEAEGQGINIPGRMYISDHHICFASGQLPLFLKVVPMIEVTNVLKKGATFLFPKIVIENSSGIDIFNSVTLRDKAYDLIATLVNKARGEKSLGIDLKTMQNEGRRQSKKDLNQTSLSDEDVNYSDLVFRKEDFEQIKTDNSTPQLTSEKKSPIEVNNERNSPHLPPSRQRSPQLQISNLDHNDNNNNNNNNENENNEERNENDNNERLGNKIKLRRQRSKSFGVTKADIIAIQPLLTSSQLQVEPSDGKLPANPLVITPNPFHHNNFLNQNQNNNNHNTTKLGSSTSSPPLMTSLSPSISPTNLQITSTPTLSTTKRNVPNTDPTHLRSQSQYVVEVDFEDEEGNSEPKLDLDVLRQGKKSKAPSAPVPLSHANSSDQIPQLLSELIDLSDIPSDSPSLRHSADISKSEVPKKKLLSKSTTAINENNNNNNNNNNANVNIGDKIEKENVDNNNIIEKDETVYPPIGNSKLFSHIPIVSPPVVEQHFPITCKQFYSKFFNNRPFWTELMQKNENTEVVVPDWSSHPTHFSRVVTFVSPIKGAPIGPKQTRNEQTHQISFVNDQHLILDTSNKSLDIPYSDSFLVQTLWDIKDQNSGGCTLKISLRIHFLKSVFMKSLIEKSAKAAYDAFLQLFVKEAQKYLKSDPSINKPILKKNIDQKQEIQQENGEIAEEIEEIRLTPVVEEPQQDFFYSFSLSGKTFVTSIIILFVVFFGLFYLTIQIRYLEEELHHWQKSYVEYEDRIFFLQIFTSKVANRVLNSTNALDTEWAQWQKSKGLNWRVGEWKEQIISLQQNLQQSLEYLNGLVDDVNSKSANVISENLIRTQIISTLDSEKVFFTPNSPSSFLFYIIIISIIVFSLALVAYCLFPKKNKLD